MNAPDDRCLVALESSNKNAIFLFSLRTFSSRPSYIKKNLQGRGSLTAELMTDTKGLVTNYGERGEGGYKTGGGGGHVKFYPYEKGGGPKKF